MGKNQKNIFWNSDKYIRELLQTLINKQIETINFSEEDAVIALKSKIGELNIVF